MYILLVLTAELKQVTILSQILTVTFDLAMLDAKFKVKNS